MRLCGGGISMSRSLADFEIYERYEKCFWQRWNLINSRKMLTRQRELTRLLFFSRKVSLDENPNPNLEVSFCFSNHHYLRNYTKCLCYALLACGCIFSSQLSTCWWNYWCFPRNSTSFSGGHTTEKERKSIPRRPEASDCSEKGLQGLLSEKWWHRTLRLKRPHYKARLTDNDQSFQRINWQWADQLLKNQEKLIQNT